MTESKAGAKQLIWLSVFAVISFLAVVGVRNIWKTEDKLVQPDDAPDSSVPIVQPNELKETEERLDRVDQRVDDLTAAVQDLGRRLAVLEQSVATFSRTPPSEENNSTGAPSAPTLSDNTSAPSATPDSAGIKDTLNSAWQYVAKDHFDPDQYKQIHKMLISACKVKGLAPDSKASVKAAIQQVNEIAVVDVIDEYQSKPSAEATQRLRTFLKTTPDLTQEQRAHLRSVLAPETRSS